MYINLPINNNPISRLYNIFVYHNMMNTPEDIQAVKDQIANGEPDKIENGKEVYETPNGIRINIDNQADADLVLGNNFTPTETTPQPLDNTPQERVVKQNYWDNPEKIIENFKTFEEGMKNSDAERYNRFQDTGEDQGKDFSITEDSKIPLYTDYAKSEEEKAILEKNLQDTIDSNSKRNEGFTNAPLSKEISEALSRQDELAAQLKEDQRRREAKEREIEINTTRNEGFTNAAPSQQMIDALAKQDKLAAQLKQENEKYIPTVKPELDLNKSLRENSLEFRPNIKVAYNSEGSERTMISFTEVDTPRFGYDELKEALENQFVKDDGSVMITYLGGRRGNNGNPKYSIDIIFTQDQISQLDSLIKTVETDKETIVADIGKKNYQDSITELMDKETAKKYLKALGAEQEVIEPTPEEIETNRKLNEIGERITDIDIRLEAMNQNLQDINQNLQQFLERQSLEQLTSEKLLEYTKLLLEKGKTRDEIFQVTMEKYQNALDLILTKLSVPIEPDEPITPVTPPPVTPPPVTPPPVTPPPVTPQPVTPQPVVPQPVTPQPVTPQPVTPPPVIPGPVTANADVIRNLQDQLSELRGENTWEQRSANYAKDLEALDALQATRPLTISEKAQYFDLLKQKEYIDKNVIAPVEKENERKRIRKERIIKIVAGVAGAGVALATPAVGVAAVIGVTLGGRLIGKGLAKWGANLRSTSTAMKYESRRGKSIEELQEMDKKQQRREWWGKRLGEASSVFIGGATGYGLGKAVQSLFGWGQGTTVETNPATEPTQPTTPGPQEPTSPINPTGPEVPPVATEPIPSELPNYLSFDQYPDMKVGLETRGMAEGMNDLIIHPSESLWSTAQRQAVEALTNQGVNLNTREAGYAIGDLASNLINNGQAITPDAVTQALAEAATKFGQ